MKAAVYEGKEQVVLREVKQPELEDGEVLLKIEACSVCGTDLRTYRHGDAKIKPPRILGHEFCGVVVESRAGPEAPVAVGDRVVMYIVLACGTCRYCKKGRPNLCTNRTTMAYHHDGAFAPYMKVPARAVDQLFKVSGDISSAEMSLAEPLGCVINAHSKLGVGLKDTVVVIGAGPIGVMHALVSRLQGAQKVYLLDTAENRLKIAHRFDLDGYATVKPDHSHRDQIKEWTDGFGPDVVIVACSVAAAQADALEIAGILRRAAQEQAHRGIEHQSSSLQGTDRVRLLFGKAERFPGSLRADPKRPVSRRQGHHPHPPARARNRGVHPDGKWRGPQGLHRSLTRIA
jgi:L-iditol 2-dehydrogenase